MATIPTHVIFLSDGENEISMITFSKTDKKSMLAISPEFKSYINENFNINTIKAEKVYEELLNQFKYGGPNQGLGHFTVMIIMTIERFAQKTGSVITSTGKVILKTPGFDSVK